MPEFVDLPNIFETFKESRKCGATLGVQCVGDLNRLVNRTMSGDLKKFI